MEKKITHMKFIQDTITRMARNSFLLKEWSVTLLVGIIILADKDADKGYLIIAYLPIIIFWLLDTYYLKQERLFRNLYNKVREKEEIDIDFDMNTKGAENKDTFFWNCFKSTTESGFYFPLAVVLTVLVFTDFFKIF